MNKKGDVVLRDIVFIIFIFSGIIALAGIFVQQMGSEYENVNMTTSYNQDAIGVDQLESNSTKWQKIGDGLSGNLFSMVGAVLEGAVAILQEVFLAPVTFSNMIVSILTDLSIDTSVTNIIGFIISSILYIIIIFVIISAFLKGGRM